MTTTTTWAAAPPYAPARASVRPWRRLRKLRQLDWTLLTAVLALSVVGALLVWSATRERMIFAGEDPQSFLKKHVLNLTIGLVLGGLALRLNYRLLRLYAPVLYGISLAGLALVLAIGTEINGAKAWIVLPAGFSLQPSEFAKVALVLTAAMVLSEKRKAAERQTDEPRHRDVFKALLLGGVPLALVLLQDDLGTMIVLAALLFGMIVVSGASMRWVVGMALVTVTAAGFVVASGLLDDYQIRRLTSFANPAADPRGAGYNTQQARIAIGSGGLTGAGLFQGPQTQGRFVPEQQTDFIFTVAGEELGFVGAGAIVGLFGLVLWRACRIGARSKDVFGRLIVVGVVCWFAFQTFQNIGMCVGIMPVTGLPLPFVSYGGSAMFANWIGVGLLLNVGLRSK